MATISNNVDVFDLCRATKDPEQTTMEDSKSISLQILHIQMFYGLQLENQPTP